MLASDLGDFRRKWDVQDSMAREVIGVGLGVPRTEHSRPPDKGDFTLHLARMQCVLLQQIHPDRIS